MPYPIVYPCPIWTDSRGRRRIPQITSGFREQRKAYPGTGKPYKHSGVDIMYPALDGDEPYKGRYTAHRSKAFYCPDGLYALSTEPGIIDWVGDYGGTGLGITLALDGGDIVLYAHLVDGTHMVSKGTRVAEGTRLAEIGGNPSNAPGLHHLHLELWGGGDRRRRYDPEVYLARARKVAG